jgi:branched-subunit amino acid transport protein
MSWSLVIALGVTSLILRGSGFALSGRRLLSPAADRRLQQTAIALLGGVIGTQTLTTGGQVAIDARIAGLAVALAGAIAQRSILLIFASSVAVTAVLRLVAG